MGDTAGQYLSAIESEIRDVKGVLSYYRANLLVAVFAVSALFWDLADLVGKNEFTIQMVSRVSPFVVAVLLFIVSAMTVIRTYKVKAGTKISTGLEDNVDWLPHLLVQALAFPIGALMSALAIQHYYDVGVDSIGPVWLLFGFAFLNFAGALIMVVSVKTRRTIGRAESRTGMSKSWRFQNTSSVFYSVLGAFCLYIAWHNDPSVSVLALSVKGTLTLILVAYILERIGHISECISSLDRLKRARRLTYGKILATDEGLLKSYSEILDKIQEHESQVVIEEEEAERV